MWGIYLVGLNLRCGVCIVVVRFRAPTGLVCVLCCLF